MGHTASMTNERCISNFG